MVTVLSLTLSVITLSTAKSMITFADMTTKKPVVLVRFQPDVKDALNDAASKDGRSLSSLLEKIAVDWLRINGRPEIELRGPKETEARAMKIFALALFAAIAAAPAAHGGTAATHSGSIVLSNWKTCATKPLSDNGSAEADWFSVPAWTKNPAIAKYFYNDPRLLANHGLCNKKFRRVVLCLPGWQTSPDKDSNWYSICSGVFERRLRMEKTI